MTVVAMPLATSPALYPPMPSASTTSPFAASAAIESSLCERTMPGSVQLAISRVCVRSMPSLDFDVHAAGSRGGRRGGPRERGLQRAGELFAGLEALVRILAQCPIEEGDEALGKIGSEAADVGGRLVRDL